MVIDPEFSKDMILRVLVHISVFISRYIELHGFFLYYVISNIFFLICKTRLILMPKKHHTVIDPEFSKDMILRVLVHISVFISRYTVIQQHIILKRIIL
jgi:hypothetical protein